jgi:glutamyl-tRNA synthetase
MNQNEITVPIGALYAENRKIIEKTSRRYFCIENPKKIKIEKAPKETAVLPLHPEYPEYGTRKMETSGEFYIEEKDWPEKGKNYRLMHLFNFRDEKYLSSPYAPALGTKQIHWLPVSKNLEKASVVMEDGTKREILAEPDIKNIKIGETIQFERKFFATLNSKKPLTFWYCHP